MRPNPNRCPENVSADLYAYMNDGVPCGDFLTACLENNLANAFGRADEQNRDYLMHIVAFIWNELPGNIWGSQQKVQAHLASFKEDPTPERDEPPTHDVSDRWDGGMHNRPSTEQNV